MLPSKASRGTKRTEKKKLKTSAAAAQMVIDSSGVMIRTVSLLWLFWCDPSENPYRLVRARLSCENFRPLLADDTDDVRSPYSPGRPNRIGTDKRGHNNDASRKCALEGINDGV